MFGTVIMSFQIAILGGQRIKQATTGMAHLSYATGGARALYEKMLFVPRYHTCEYLREKIASTRG